MGSTRPNSGGFRSASGSGPLLGCLALLALPAACGTDEAAPRAAPGHDAGGTANDGSMPDAPDESDAPFDDGGALDAYSADADAAPPSACFRRSDNANLSFEFGQQLPPPDLDALAGDYPETSASYPGNSFATANVGELADPSPSSPTGYGFEKLFFLWSNRCIRLPGITPPEPANPANDACRNKTVRKGNPYRAPAVVDGEELRAAFSTYARAEACTRLQARRAFGAPASALDNLAQTFGLTWLDTDDRSGLPALATSVTFTAPAETRKYLVDVCITEPRTLASDVAGSFLDHEVQDDRSAQRVYDFVLMLRGDLPQKVLHFYTNPLDKTGHANGLYENGNPNVRNIVNQADAFLPVLSTGFTPGNPAVDSAPQPHTRSYEEAYQAMLGFLTDGGSVALTAAQKSKLVLALSLNDSDPDANRLVQMKLMRNHVETSGYRGVEIWRNLAKLGGGCERIENQLLACLGFGVCDGTWGK